MTLNAAQIRNYSTGELTRLYDGQPEIANEIVSRAALIQLETKQLQRDMSSLEHELGAKKQDELELAASISRLRDDIERGEITSLDELFLCGEYSELIQKVRAIERAFEK